MNSISNSMQTILSSGPLVIILGLLSITALTLVILKCIDLRRLKLGEEIKPEQLIQRVRKEGASQVISDLQQQESPQAQIAAKALDLCTFSELSPESIEKELSAHGLKQLKRVEHSNGTISLIANLSPLLGLLGTVLGMISAFRGLESAGMKADPSVLAGGIWEALLTTAMGLSIAIPLLAFVYFFEKLAEKSNDDMSEICTYIVNRFKPQHYSRTSEQEQGLSSLQ